MTKRFSLIWVLVLMSMTLVVSEAAAQRGRGPGQGWRRGYGPRWYQTDPNATGWQGRDCLFGPRMADELGITPAQQASIDKLYAQALERVEPLLRQLDRIERELWALEASAKSGAGSAAQLRKTAQNLEGKIEDVWSQYRKQVLALLTKEQRQQYEEGVVGYGPYGGWGDGRGYAPGYGPGYGYGRGMGWRGGYGRGRGRRW